jgi:DNA end-binding protein Ku
MSAHPIGSATISFGLVSVPIKLYSAGEPAAAVSFNWLHKTDGSRLKQQYFCPKDGEVVDKDGMIKGYEFAKGQYVQFTAEELKALDERGTGAIDVKEFLPAAQVDRIYLEKTYYLGPDKGGERAYRLLAEALKKTGRVAVGQYAARGKGYLILIRPVGERLAMEQLRYAAELRSIAEVPVGDVEVKPAELALAVQFIEQAATDEFRPEAYEDKVRQRVLEAIQRKVEGKQIVEAPEEAPQAKIIDLMEALKQSLAKGKEKEEQEKEEKPAKKRARG